MKMRETRAAGGTKRKMQAEGKNKNPAKRRTKEGIKGQDKAHRFIIKLASKLTSEAGAATDRDEILAQFQAAIESLPQGKLRETLAKNTKSSSEVFSKEVIRLGTTITGKLVTRGEGKQKIGLSTEEPTNTLVCTYDMYQEKRVLAQKETDGYSLYTLAANPRAPCDLLLSAMARKSEVVKRTKHDKNKRLKGGAAKGLAALHSKVFIDLDANLADMRTLSKAIAIDVNGLLSSRGQAFYAARANVLASRAVRCLVELVRVQEETKNGHAAGPIGYISQTQASSIEKSLGLILRLLNAIGLAIRSLAPRTGVSSSMWGEAGVIFDLSCVPKTSSSEGSVGKSVAYLLAHYAAVLMLAVGLIPPLGGREESSEASSAALVRRVSNLSVSGCTEDDNGSSNSDSDSYGDSEEEFESAGRVQGRGQEAAAEHVLILCAGHLHGDELKTLEMLQCVGTLCFPWSSASTKTLSPLPHRAAVAIAPVCSSLLSCLPQTRSKSPGVNNASLYLKRAFAAKIVSHLLLLPTSTPLVGGKRGSGAKGVIVGGQGQGGKCDITEASGAAVAAAGRARRFFAGAGAAPVPPDLLAFILRTDSLALPPDGQRVLTELAALVSGPGWGRGKSDGTLAAIAEYLQLSESCDPTSLGCLLNAVESMTGPGKGASAAVGGGGEAVGFIIDKVGAGQEEAGVLMPFEGVQCDADDVVAMEEFEEEGELRGGGAGGVEDADVEESEQVVKELDGEGILGSGTDSDEGDESMEEAGPLGFVLDTRGQR